MKIDKLEDIKNVGPEAMLIYYKEAKLLHGNILSEFRAQNGGDDAITIRQAGAR